MNIIDFEYKRKFNVDIWKQDKSSREKQNDSELSALRKKLVLNEMKMSYITGCNTHFCLLQVKNLCKLFVIHRTDGGHQQAFKNTRIPLAMHDDVSQMPKNIISASECRWHIGMSRLIFLSPFM